MANGVMDTKEVENWIREKVSGSKRAAVLEELKKLVDVHGYLTSKIVLEAAREPESLLHHLFEWNDDVAAEKFRIIQAGALIRTVKVVVEIPDRAPVEVRAFVSPAPGFGFIPIQKVLTDEDLKKQLLTQALKDLSAFKTRYAVLSELATLFGAIEEIEKAELDKAG